MNQTKLEELIKKWEDDLDRMDRAALSRFRIEEFIDDLKSLKSEQEDEECVHGSQKHCGDKHTCLTCGADLYWDNESNKYRCKFNKNGISEQEVNKIEPLEYEYTWKDVFHKINEITDRLNKSEQDNIVYNSNGGYIIPDCYKSEQEVDKIEKIDDTSNATGYRKIQNICSKINEIIDRLNQNK